MGKFTELNIQRGIIRWARMEDMNRPELALLHSIPNGAHVSDRNRMSLVSSGLLSGIPDLFLPVPRGTFHGLYIEVKSPTGRVSKPQKYIMDLLTAQNFKCTIVRSFLDGIDAIETYLDI